MASTIMADIDIYGYFQQMLLKNGSCCSILDI